MISIVIPVLNEEKNLKELLPTLKKFTKKNAAEIVVSDGGSSDNSVAVAQKYAHVVHSPMGRGIQMNNGALEAQGDILLFLHADARVSSAGFSELKKVLKDEQVIGGAFQTNYQSTHWLAPIMQTTARLRSRFFRIYYGDQGIFVRSSFFLKLRGYKNLPLLEDVEFTKQMRKKGKTVLLSHAVSLSARRFEQHGFLNVYLRDALALWMYRMGFSPRFVKKFYF